MYAIVNISGQQFKAIPGGRLRVPLMDAEVGGQVTLGQVMLWADGENLEIGKPYLEGRTLQAEVVRHGKGKKVIVFKKKRRKKYRRKNGHRQQFTEIRFGDF